MGVGVKSNDRLCDLDCTDYLVYFFECAEHSQWALNRLARVVVLCIVSVVPSKCKALLQRWISLVPSLIIDPEELTTVNTFTYLDIHVTRDSSMTL